MVYLIYVKRQSPLTVELGAFAKKEITHFVSFYFWLIIQGLHLIPIQDNFGVWWIPYDVSRGLTWRCKKIKIYEVTDY